MHESCASPTSPPCLQATARLRRLRAAISLCALAFLVAALVAAGHAADSLQAELAVCAHSTTVVLSAIVIWAPPLVTPVMPLLQLLVVFAGSATATSFGDFTRSTTMMTAAIWLLLLVHIIRLPLRLVRYALVGVVGVLIVTTALGRAATSPSTLAVDGVAFAALVLLVHASASSEHRDRTHKLQERYQLRKAALLSEQLLRTILPDDVARQLLLAVPPERLTRHYQVWGCGSAACGQNVSLALTGPVPSLCTPEHVDCVYQSRWRVLSQHRLKARPGDDYYASRCDLFYL